MLVILPYFSTCFLRRKKSAKTAQDEIIFCVVAAVVERNIILREVGRRQIENYSANIRLGVCAKLYVLLLTR